MNSLHIPYAEISAIQLYVLGSEENERDSFISIKYQDSYKHNMPYPYGIHDLRMGTFDSELPCQTCENMSKLCPGHPGMVELKYPVQSPLFLKEIQRWLKVICANCGKPLMSDEKLNALIKSKKVGRDKILKEYRQAMNNTKSVTCAHCQAVHLHIIRDQSDSITLFRVEYEKNMEDSKDRIVKKEKIYPHEIRNIFNKITDETVLQLGKPLICHPKKFILDKVRAPPNTIRPDIRKLGGGRSTSNDVTVLLQNIIKVNSRLPDTIPNEISPDLGKDIHLLELHVYEMIKGSSSTQKQTLTNNSNKPLTSIAKRLPRKFGRIKRNLMGRHASHMARSIITCDPTLKVDEIGVPVIICKDAQIPMFVREYNYEDCMIYFMNGATRYPGCAKMKRSDGTVCFVNESIQPPRIGDIIYRDLIDGDIVNYNRQPSLEPSSVTSFRVRVMHIGNTIRMNVLSCYFFNADFDGDEMNILMARTSRTINEITQLASPAQRFISYKSSAPAVGEVQDSLIGTAELTRSSVRLNKQHAMNMFANVDVYPDFSKYAADHIFTGRDMISILLQETGLLINFTRVAKYYDKVQAIYRNYDPEDIYVEIHQGVLKSGILDKSSIGVGVSGSIFHIVHNQYGAEAALLLAHQIQQLALTYLENRGVTVSIRDLMVRPEYLAEIHDVELSLIADSIQITENLNAGKIIAPLGKTIDEHFEALQLEALDPGDKFWPSLLKSIDPEINCFDKLIMYGSKGSMANFKNVSSAVGQITVNGERTKEGFGRRGLPYFTRYDSDPRARGYIPDSYLQGIGVAEFMFHTWDTRYALITLALTTSVTGTFNRMAIKNLEAHIVDNYRRVSKSGRITQLLYGSDGVDPRYLERVDFPTIDPKLTYSDLEAKYRVRGKNPQEEKLLKSEYEQILKDRELFISMNLRREIVNSKMFKNEAYLPVNVKRIIDDALYDFGLKQGRKLTKTAKPVELDIPKALAVISELCEILPYCLYNETAKRERIKLPVYAVTSTTLTQILIRSYLNIATLIKFSISNDILVTITKKIELSYLKSMISYGTAVGIIAAQSISEPLSQMIIDSKHRSGLGGTQTAGIGRYNEVIRASPTDKMKSPMMILYLLPEYNNRVKAQEIANNIEMLSVHQFVNSWQIFYEAYGKPVHSAYRDESKLIAEFEKYNVHVKPPSDLLNWCIRFTMNKQMLVEKQVKMSTIYSVLRKKFAFTHIVYTTDNSQNIIMRIYIRNTINVKGLITVSKMTSLVNDPDGLLNTIVRGINGINAAFMRESNRNVLQSDGSIKSEKIYAIHTIGCNMQEILMNPYIDKTSINTNSIIDVYNFYGIDAARTKLIGELGIQTEGKSVYRHWCMYADEMTYSGRVTPIDRFGAAIRESSIMLRISDASPLGVIEESAINGAIDTLKGVSPPLMIGRNPYIGDLYNSFKLDENFISQNSENLDSILDKL